MTCDNTAHFLSSFYFSFSTLPQQRGDCYFCKTLILSPFSHKAPSNLKHKAAFPCSSARPPKPNPLCKWSGAPSLPLPGRLLASPHPYSLPKTGSLEGATSGVSSRMLSYLGKTCLGMDRRLRTALDARFMTKLVSLQCKVPPGPQRQSFHRLWSYSKWYCSHAQPPRNQLTSLGPAQQQTVLTKQWFPDYTLRPDFANAGTTIPLSLSTAWQQSLKKTHKNPEGVTEGRMSRRTSCFAQSTLMQSRTCDQGGTAPHSQPPIMQTEPTRLLSRLSPGHSWSSISDFTSSRGCKSKSMLILRACKNWLECMNQSLHSPMTPPTASLQL